MSIISALVLFAVIWFITLFVVLPLGAKSQREAGDVVPGTPASAPENPMLKKKAIWVTIVAFLIWAPLVALILSGWVSIRDIDIFNRMPPLS